jgi:hypothetical protein
MRSLLLALALLALGSPGPARAEDDAAPPRIYRWVDENGIAHYTTDPDRIPRSLRRRYDLPAEPLRNEPLDARAPASAPAVTPATPGAGPDAWASQEKTEPPAPPLQAHPRRGGRVERKRASRRRRRAAGDGSGERLSRSSCASPGSRPRSPPTKTRSQLDQRPGRQDAITLGDKPEFREIAQRLPKRIQELEALQRERDALQTAVP